MIYLTDTEEIKDIILSLQETEILWLDTEVADYQTNNPRLSLIQVLAYPHDLKGDRTYLFDVLDNHEITDFFVEKIMQNEQIIKVFHNAKYDLKFLGKNKAQNIFCTLEFAKTFPFHILPVKKYSLKALTEHLTPFQNLSKEEQASDWGTRPLSSQQLEYAKMDCVYLAQIYHKLQELQTQMSYEPTTEDINSLLSRHQEIEEQWLYLDSEKKFLESKIKAAMIAQNIKENDIFKLSYTQRKIVKTDIQELINLVNTHNLNLDFQLTLTKKIQEQIGKEIDELPVEIDLQEYYSLKAKN